MINLLPKNYKQNLNRDYWLRVVTVTFWLLIMSSAVIGVLLALEIVKAQFEIKGLEKIKQAEEQQESRQTFLAAREKIKLTNQRVEVLSGLLRVDRLPGDLFEEVIKLKPASVKIKSLSYATTTSVAGSLSLAGLALTRTDLLKYIDLLKQNPVFSQVESPVGNLIRDKNVEFTLVLTVAQ
jgi:Tfp pilus assembly protein PilN